MRKSGYDITRRALSACNCSSKDGDRLGDALVKKGPLLFTRREIENKKMRRY